GTVDVTRVLNEGEVWFYDGSGGNSVGDTQPTKEGNVNLANDLKTGAVITSTQPVGVDVLFGGLDSFGTRNINIFQSLFFGDTYYTPVSDQNFATGTAQAPTRVYFYNPLAAPITINWTSSTASGNVVVPASSSAFLALTGTSGYRFQSAGGESYTAIQVIDDDTAGSGFDWAFTLIAAERLTNFSSIAWAPGSTTNAVANNANPIWVTNAGNVAADVFVKFDGNLSAPGSLGINACGLPFDFVVNLDPLEQVKIFDTTDGDQGGIAVFSCGTPLATIYGQDAITANTVNGGGGPVGLDVGTVMQPKCLDFLVIANDDVEVTEPNTPIIVDILVNDAGFLCTINRSSVQILTPPTNGTVQVNTDGTITYTPNPGFNGLETFTYLVCSNEFITGCDEAQVNIRVTTCPATASEAVVSGRVFVEQLPDDGTYNVGERLQGGVPVLLFTDLNCNNTIDGADTAIQSTTSDLSGNYSFSVVPGFFFADDFEPSGIAGNDGSLNFSSSWIESGGTNDFAAVPTTIGIESGTNNSLILNGPNRTAARSFNVVNAVSASLSFRYRRAAWDNAADFVTVTITNGATSAVTVLQVINFSQLAADTGFATITLNVPTGALNNNGSNTISFTTSGGISNTNSLFIDNVRFTYGVNNACYIARPDVSGLAGRFTVSTLNQANVGQSPPLVALGNCVSGRFLGVLANYTAVADNFNIVTDVPRVLNILANDTPGVPNPASVTIISGPTNGQVVVNPDGTVTYTPNLGYNGPDSFQYNACSIDDPTVCSTTTVTLNVACTSVANRNTITGTVFNDLNNNATQNAGELGVANASIQLYRDVNTNGLFDSGTDTLETTVQSSATDYQIQVVPPTVSNTLLDQFNTAGSGTGTNGTVNWTNPWVQLGEVDGFGTGSVQVTGGALSLQNTARGARRSFNLAAAGAISASLTYTFTKTGLDVNTDGVIVDVSNASGGTYTTLSTLTIPNAGAQSSGAIDITSFISTDTTVRFQTTATNATGDIVTIDNVLITYTTYTGASYIVRLGSLPSGFVQTAPVSPNFYAVSFTGSGAASCSRNFGAVVQTDLSITKTVNNSTPTVPSSVTFTLTASNNGPGNATSVTVNDLLPSGYTFVSATPSLGSYNSTTGVWNIGNLNNAASATLTITATVRGTGSYANTATISGGQIDPSTGNNTAVNTPTPVLRSDIALTKSVDVINPQVGTDVVFTITATNDASFSDATGLIISDLLPTGYLFVSATPSSGTYNNLSGLWNIGNLNAGASATLQITATVRGTGIYQNVATLNNVNPTDAVAGNNSANVTTSPIPQTDIAVTKVANNNTPSVGSTIQFTIQASNNSNFSPATGLTISDVLPSGYNFVSANATLGTYSQATGIWSIGNLAPGASETLTINAVVLGSGTYANTASLSTVTPSDINLSNNSGSSTPVPTAASELSVIKTSSNNTPSVGDTIFFTLSATNAAGYSNASGVQVSDVLPSGYQFVNSVASVGSYNPITGVWTIGSLNAGSSASLQLEVLVVGNGNYQNIATISGTEPDFNPGNNSSSNTPTVSPTADLSSTKSVSNSAPQVGSNVVFTIVVANSSISSNATGVTVTDQLPSGYSFVSAVTSVGTYNSITGIWNVGSLNAGSNQTLQITATVLGSGVYANTASSTSTLPDPNPGNNNSSSTPTPSPAAELSVTKIASTNTPNVGSNVTFTITATNNVNFSNASGVVVTDVLQSGYNFVSAVPSVGTYNQLTGVWTIGNLNAGSTETLTITATVLGSGDYSNSANVNSVTVDPVPGNNTSSITPTPVPQADLELSKTVNNATPNVASNITFSLNVLNNGLSAATNVLVTDLLPSGYSFVSAVPSVGTYNPVNGQWSVGNIAAGANASLDITVSVNASGLYNNSATSTADQNDPNPANNDDTVIVNPVPVADVSVVKSVNNNSPAVGDTIIFTLSASNAGPSNATAVAVTDLLPSGYSFVSSNPSVGTYNNVSGVWNIGTLLNGSSATLDITVIVAPLGSKLNTATISANESDLVPGNNTSSVTPSVVNTPPVANDDSNSVLEDGTLIVANGAPGDLILNDLDSDLDPLTIIQFVINGTTYNAGDTAVLSEGNVTVNANGSYTYIPAVNFNGVVPPITYTLSDGIATDTAILSITVTPDGASVDTPTAVNDTATTAEDTPTTITVLANDNFGGDGPNTGTIQVTQGANGTVTINDGGTPNDPTDDTVTYTPNANFNGSDSFTYTITDSNGDSSTATVSVTVTPDGASVDTPTAVNDT
ncbi:Ig-like domain-containing protein, partial [Flavobacterium sp.]|uniref:Ig-like domain-containing protein n=1 Tax=Flavobacterium sp. TaxID=239 RepID=UPI003B9A6FCB